MHSTLTSAIVASGDPQLIHRRRPTWEYCWKRFLVQSRIVGSKNKFKSPCRKTVKQVNIFLFPITISVQFRNGINKRRNTLFPGHAQIRVLVGRQRAHIGLEFY